MDGTARIDWTVEFLQACWELRDASEGACDVKSIEVFAMHDYTCFYQDSLNKYQVNSTKEDSFYKYLIDKLTDKQLEGGQTFDWASWIPSIPIWITEQNCNHEIPPYAQTSNVKACQELTGTWTSDSRWGKGSVYAVRELDNI